MPSPETIDALWQLGGFFVFMAGMVVVGVLAFWVIKKWM